MPNKKMLVCDLDNTLYDWVGYYVPSFYAMVDSVVEITGCDRDVLLDDFRSVHQKYHNSEHPFALLETETIRRFYKGVSSDIILKSLDPAFHAFNSTRKKTLDLYPGVRDTLERLSTSDIKLVAHTDSNLYGVVDRLQRMNLTKYFSKIYCKEPSPSTHPNAKSRTSWLEQFPIDKIKELAHHQIKPNPSVLLEICADENVAPDDAAYIGDSIAKDILMAKRANVFAIWAAYGAAHSTDMYTALVRVSHWTKEEVDRELQLKEEAKSIKPDYIARYSFIEVLEALEIKIYQSAIM